MTGATTLSINQGVGATHPQALVKAVRRHRADLGIALDGDADRLLMVDGEGTTYDGDQLGQGKENARQFLRDNPDLADELEKRIKEKLGVGARMDLPADDLVVDLPEITPIDL